MDMDDRSIYKKMTKAYLIDCIYARQQKVAALEAENHRLKCRDSCKDGEHCTYIDEMAKSLKEKDALLREAAEYLCYNELVDEEKSEISKRIYLHLEKELGQAPVRELVEEMVYTISNTAGKETPAPAAKCRVYERLHCVGCPWTQWAGKLGAPCVHCIYYEPEAPAKKVTK
jgi:hypothetical protein